MALNVAKELAAMERMTVNELRAKYAEVFGEPARSRHKQWLVKRILWRLQSLEEGDLSERARRRAEELANDADLRMAPPRQRRTSPEPVESSVVSAPSRTTDGRLPMPGAVLTRQYQGRTLRVHVLPKGFEWEGVIYKSLSAVARAITGTHWNGYHFFGLQGKAGNP